MNRLVRFLPEPFQQFAVYVSDLRPPLGFLVTSDGRSAASVQRGPFCSLNWPA